MTIHASAPMEKPLATPTIAQALGQWAAQENIAAIVVFGVDVVFAVHQNGEQVILPRQFNDVVWGLGQLQATQTAFKAAGMLSRQTDLAIQFEAGILPGDPGFELPEPVAGELVASST